ncbi:uncharacterized protein PSFLO_03726 [Pseudozyma flocculosa]|uniref:RecA family profile 1 domain-containing protein n=1 Tax=Pseudozyma flocculosa TaxID=84751 RepID=A0A5C3F476_9BASI|nr:uncharacterized protein PSFLO_03726 [Pseudozyma flocculosa]
MTSLPVPVQDVASLSKRFKACCRRAKLFNADQIVLSKFEDLTNKLGLNHAEAGQVFRAAARTVAPRPAPVLGILMGSLPDEVAPYGSEDAADDTDGSSSEPSSLHSPAAAADTLLSSLIHEIHGNFDGQPASSSGSSSRTSEQGSNRSHTKSRSSSPPEVDVLGSGASVRTAAAHTDIIGGKRKAFDQGDALDSRGALNNGPATGEACSVHCGQIEEALYDGQPRRILTTGDTSLDDLLNGGVYRGALTEIVGESTSGKTQLAVQLAVCATLGLLPTGRELGANAVHDSAGPMASNDSVKVSGTTPRLDVGGATATAGGCCGIAYITSGGHSAAQAFVRRAVEVADSAVRKRLRNAAASAESCPNQQDEDAAVDQAKGQLLANMHIACVNDVEALDHALKFTLPGLFARTHQPAATPSVRCAHTSSAGQSGQQAPIGLVIVDSLPPLFHEDSATQSMDNLVHRSRALVEISDSLKRLAGSSPGPYGQRAGTMGAAVVVLNHVSDAFDAEKEIANRFVFSSSDRLRAARKGINTPNDAARDVWEADAMLAPMALPYAEQGAFFTGLLASVPPTLAETLSLVEPLRTPSSSGNLSSTQLYALQPKTAQLGHVWANSINVRLMLSKTRGRVSPDSAGLEYGLSRDATSPQRPQPHLLNPYTSLMVEARPPAREASNAPDITPGTARITPSATHDDDAHSETLDLDNDQLAAFEADLQSASLSID